MSDSDDGRGGIPAWQREQQQSETESQLQPEPAPQDTKDETPGEDKLEVARRFLQDDEIRDAPREMKEDFLKTKGLTSPEIEELLDGEPVPESARTVPLSTESRTRTTPATDASSPPQDQISLPRQTDSPPVITYPEFLTKPTRPPPLITANAVVHTLCAFAGISTLLYGTSKFVVAPMVETQTEARTELHSLTAQKLSALVSKLESTVSEVPAPKKPTIDPQQQQQLDDGSDIDDPSELFHRDIGTQTSFPSTPKTETATADDFATAATNKTPAERHHFQLAKMKLHAQQLRDTCVSEAEDLAHAKSEMDLLKDDLVQLAYPAPREYTSGLYCYGSRSNEPDDEIKKAKDNIRRVKGVLLSTRNFPASVR